MGLPYSSNVIVKYGSEVVARVSSLREVDESFDRLPTDTVATITGGTYDKGDTAYAAVILTYDANSDGKIGVGDYYMTGTGSYTLESDMNATPGLSMGSWTQIASTTPTPPGPGPVPEPTSGLLLLVGAGMLALRRKQK